MPDRTGAHHAKKLLKRLCLRNGRKGVDGSQQGHARPREKPDYTIIPKELEPDEVIIETDVPEELKGSAQKDDMVGTASVCFIRP